MTLNPLKTGLNSDATDHTKESTVLLSYNSLFIKNIMYSNYDSKKRPMIPRGHSNLKSLENLTIPWQNMKDDEKINNSVNPSKPRVGDLR